MATIPTKGITIDQLPERIKKKLTQAQQEEYVARWKIVAHDAQGKPLVKEELIPALLKTVSPKARRAAGFLLAMDLHTRQEVLGLFQADGQVKFPWPIENSPG